MKHEDQLKSLRSWFTQHKTYINVRGLAVKLEISHTTLARAITEDVDQQRNVSPETLLKITKVLTELNFNPKKDYAKAN